MRQMRTLLCKLVAKHPKTRSIFPDNNRCLSQNLWKSFLIGQVFWSSCSGPIIGANERVWAETRLGHVTCQLRNVFERERKLLTLSGGSCFYVKRAKLIQSGHRGALALFMPDSSTHYASLLEISWILIRTALECPCSSCSVLLWALVSNALLCCRFVLTPLRLPWDGRYWAVIDLVSGSASSSLVLSRDRETVHVNITQNASLVWRYSVGSGDYGLLWGLTDKQQKHISTIFYAKSQDTKLTERAIPASYQGRVRIVQPATLHISGVTLNDEGYYMCELRGHTQTNKKTIRLVVIGELSAFPLAKSQRRMGEMGCVILMFWCAPADDQIFTPLGTWYCLRPQRKARIRWAGDVSILRPVQQHFRCSIQSIWGCTVLYCPADSFMRVQSVRKR